MSTQVLTEKNGTCLNIHWEKSTQPQKKKTAEHLGKSKELKQEMWNSKSQVQLEEDRDRGNSTKHSWMQWSGMWHMLHWETARHR